MPPPPTRRPARAPDPPAAPAGRRLGPTVLVLSAVSLLTDLSSEIIYPLLPLFLTGVLGAGAEALGVIEGAAETTAALLKLASGWWSDRVARRKPLVLAGYGLASAVRPLVAFATVAWHVLAVRVLDRVGKGVRSAPRDALIADATAPALRGRAFGVHRAADHLGAVAGPLVAYALLEWLGLSLRTVFLWAAVPGAAAVLLVWLGVRETPRAVPPRAGQAATVPGTGATTSAAASAAASATTHATTPGLARRADPPRLGGAFWRYLAVVLVFTLGNATDAFLLLRASQLGVAVALVPLLWAMLHVVKSASSAIGGDLSDRLGRRPLIVVGWLIYALVYYLFARASAPWHAWALFATYGLYFGLTEGTEKALVADLAPAAARGTAFGWYNLAIGIGALPASVLFGVVWERASPAAAFGLGAGLALTAAVGLLVLVPAPRRG
ncbi:MAG TPA: MFS transporter [Gemmatimonadaceae bacterium]|nr:MFS transporter [Gemmatimonadaceae bacterium]